MCRGRKEKNNVECRSEELLLIIKTYLNTVRILYFNTVSNASFLYTIFDEK